MRCWYCQPCHKQLIRAPLPLTASFHRLETATLEICIARHARCLRCPTAPAPSSPFRIPSRKSAFKNCEIHALTSKCKNRQPPTRTRQFFHLTRNWPWFDVRLSTIIWLLGLPSYRRACRTRRWGMRCPGILLSRPLWVNYRDTKVLVQFKKFQNLKVRSGQERYHTEDRSGRLRVSVILMKVLSFFPSNAWFGVF